MHLETDFCELFDGKFLIEQHLDGYRFSIDSVLLARWVDIHVVEKDSAFTVDMGTGCGVIPIILAAARGLSEITAIELQPDLFRICQKNIKNNNLHKSITAENFDLRSLPQCMNGRFTVALANPPYRELGSGRINTGNEKAVARHELELTLRQLLGVARFLLESGGRFNLVYPMRRCDELLTLLPDFDLHLSRLRYVKPREGSEANLVLLESVLGEKHECITEPPLIIYEGEQYSDEVKQMYMLP